MAKQQDLSCNGRKWPEPGHAVGLAACGVSSPNSSLKRQECVAITRVSRHSIPGAVRLHPPMCITESDAIPLQSHVVTCATRVDRTHSWKETRLWVSKGWTVAEWLLIVPCGELSTCPLDSFPPNYPQLPKLGTGFGFVI